MAVPAIGLLKATKTIHELIQMIDGGDFASSLGDIEMSAARSAFEAVPRAVDKRGQVWECVGHLSSAQHAYEQFILSRPQGNLTITRFTREQDASVKRRFALVLKAACYKYLNEQSLCDDALTLSKDTPSKDATALDKAAGLAYILSICAAPPIIFAEIIYMRAQGYGIAKEKYEIDDTTFDTLVTPLVK
jgi:hypothetical protein